MAEDGLSAAVERWIEDEMWNQSDRRPPDLHDAFAFVRAFREGERSVRREIKEQQFDRRVGDKPKAT